MADTTIDTLTSHDVLHRPSQKHLEGIHGDLPQQKKGKVSHAMAIPLPNSYDTMKPWTPSPACPSGDSVKLHGVTVAQKPKQAGVAGFFSWLWGLITGSGSEAQKTEEVVAADPTSTPAPTKTEMRRGPRLPAPDADEGNLQGLVAKMNANMRRIEDQEEDLKSFLEKRPDMSENTLLYLLIESIKMQQANRAESAQVTQEKLLGEQEVRRNLHKKMQDILAERLAADRSVGTTSWIGSILTVGILALTVVSGVFAFISGGASLPLSLMLANAGASVAQGVNTGFRGYYEGKSSHFQSEMYGTKEAKNVSHRAIQSCLDDLKQSQQYVTGCMSLHGQVVRSLADASPYRQ